MVEMPGKANGHFPIIFKKNYTDFRQFMDALKIVLNACIMCVCSIEAEVNVYPFGKGCTKKL